MNQIKAICARFGIRTFRPTLRTAEPGTEEALVAAFERAAAARANLAGIDPHALVTFVMRRRENSPTEPSEKDAATQTSTVAKILVVEQPSHAAGRDREPLLYWLFGHRDYGARLTSLVAALAVLLVGAAASVNAVQSNIRANAYAALISAAQRDDDGTVVAQGERFLSAVTLRLSAPRVAQVRELLAQARELPNRRLRDAAYRDMQEDMTRSDGKGVIDAVERFATAPPLQQKEPRAAGMRDIYAREFVHWFASLDASADVEAAARSQTYQRVAAALIQFAGDER